MGGQTGRARDNHMAELIKKYLPKASGRGGGGDLDRQGATTEQRSRSRRPAAEAMTPKPRSQAGRRRPPAKSGATVAKSTRSSSRIEQAYAEPTPKPKALAAVDPISTSSTGSAPSGWAIQVASSPSQGQAKSLLAKTGKQAPSILADAAAYTVPFDKDGVTYYRVRFGGFGSKIGGMECLRRAEEKEDRLLRRPSMRLATNS